MKPDYGLDAPGVIRNLAIGGLAAVIVAVLALALPTSVLPMARADRTISSVWFFLTGFILLIESAWMLYSSKAGKLRMRERVIDALALQGSERVLDVGCGAVCCSSPPRSAFPEARRSASISGAAAT